MCDLSFEPQRFRSIISSYSQKLYILEGDLTKTKGLLEIEKEKCWRLDQKIEKLEEAYKQFENDPEEKNMEPLEIEKLRNEAKEKDEKILMLETELERIRNSEQFELVFNKVEDEVAASLTELTDKTVCEEKKNVSGEKVDNVTANPEVEENDSFKENAQSDEQRPIECNGIEENAIQESVQSRIRMFNQHTFKSSNAVNVDESSIVDTRVSKQESKDEKSRTESCAPDDSIVDFSQHGLQTKTTQTAGSDICMICHKQPPFAKCSTDNCGGVYHEKCILNHFKTTKECPCCKNDSVTFGENLE